MRPNIDDLVVSLAVGDDALAILLLNLANLLVGLFQLGLFLFRNDHVRNSNRNAGFGCFGETELLQFVQCGHRLRWTSDLVTAPDNVAELLFTGGFVEKSKLAGPNLIENDPAWRSLDSFRLSIPIDGLPAKIGVLNPNAIVRANAALCHGKFHFGRIGKEREPLAVFTLTSRILGEVITTQRDVLRRRGNGLAARGRENVIGSEHKHARFHLSLD